MPIKRSILLFFKSSNIFFLSLGTIFPVKSEILIFSLGFFVIFFSEASIKYVGENLINNLLFSLIPLVIYLFMYLFLMKKLNYKIRNTND